MTGRETKKKLLIEDGGSARDEASAKADHILADGFTIFDALRVDHSISDSAIPAPLEPFNLEEFLHETRNGEESAQENKKRRMPVSKVSSNQAPPKKRLVTTVKQALRTLTLLFVLAWVFLLGVLVGRGNIWKSAWGQTFLLWVEKQAGWDPELARAVSPLEVVVSESGRSLERPSADSATFLRPRSFPAEETPPVLRATSENLPHAFQSQTGFEADGGVGRPAAAEPEGSPPPARLSVYTVQAAYSLSQPEAEEQIDRLAGQGYEAYCYQNGKGHFPVRVGRFANQEEAESVRRQLEEMGYKNPYISKLNE